MKCAKNNQRLNDGPRLVRGLNRCSFVHETDPIVVIDDDADIRDSLAEILVDEGYSVRTFASGAEALEHLRNEDSACCLIILDLMMPGMNGWTFREVQSHDARLSSIPVITMSAVADLDPPSPATPMLCKPVNLDQLLNRVAEQVHH
jgi:DNA-binding response OmpR family regulator